MYRYVLTGNKTKLAIMKVITEMNFLTKWREKQLLTYVYDFCSGNVDWTWREQADLVKWTRVSVTLSLELLSNLTMRDRERQRQRDSIHEINVFLQIKHFTFFQSSPQFKHLYWNYSNLNWTSYLWSVSSVSSYYDALICLIWYFYKSIAVLLFHPSCKWLLN